MARLTVLGAGYRWLPKQPTITEEIELIKNRTWGPTLADFEAISPRGAVPCRTFDEVIGLLMMQPVGSCGWLNIVTHGSPTMIAFSGTIKPKAVPPPDPGMSGVDITLTINAAPGLVALDQFALDALNSGSQFFVGNSSKPFTIDDIRARFAKPNPLIKIFSCNSGSDPRFLQEIADTFHVMVQGFRKRIAFCPRFSGVTIQRGFCNLGECKEPNAPDFYKLDQKGSVITAKHASWRPLRPDERPGAKQTP